MQRKKFGIMIVNWNRSEALDKCLQSVFSQTRKPDEVVVFDNASTDNSVQLLREKYSEKVKIIAAPINVGLCKATNICFNTLDCDYVGVVENDVTLTKNWIKDTIKELDSDKTVAIAAPLFLHRVNDYWVDVELKPVKGKELPVCGGVFAARKQFFEERKQLLYDDDYFFHAQNFELAARVIGKGGKINRLCSSASFHYIGSVRAQTAFVKRMLMRNNLWNLWRFYSKRIIAIFTPIYLLNYFIMVKNPATYFSTLVETLFGVSKCLQKKAVVKNPLFPEFTSISGHFNFMKRLREINSLKESGFRYCKEEKEFLENYSKGLWK
jgi:GT2 family glycosyltransferase